MKTNENEKRHYFGKPKSDIINFPVDLRRDLLSPTVNKEVLNMPISSTRIIFKILNDVSNEQFQKNNVKQITQVSLFEKEFKSEHNTFARFTFKVSDISDKNDYTNTKRGLEFLESLNKGWYKSVNEKGKTIKSYGGVISNANISEGNISFLVSSFWLEKLLNIPRYNVAFLETAWILSKTKQVLFYLWLLEIPDNGTKVNFKKMQETYDYNYKTPSSYVKNVLKPIKSKLDKYSNKSFNCSVKGGLINIVPYYTKDVELKLNKKTIDKQKVSQKLHYWKNRHNLNNNDIDVLKSLINIDYGNFKIFVKSYDSIVAKCRKDGIKVTSYVGTSFIHLFQEEIINIYNNSAWGNIPSLKNAYPKIK
ncbi:hypothetical protein [Tenacibaculum maritimum]|uniref:hypothetical protein n=1 Tax=Tenacibaculum maritimum TaxID=107401 RepID=UPI0038763975